MAPLVFTRIGKGRFTANPSLINRANKGATGFQKLFRGYKVRKAAKAIDAAKKIQKAFRNRLYYHEHYSPAIVRFKRKIAGRLVNKPRALLHMGDTAHIQRGGLKIFRRNKIGNVRSSYRRMFASQRPSTLFNR